MVVDPAKPEKGVFSAAFEIPTECTCSVQRSEHLDNRRKSIHRGNYYGEWSNNAV
jgi:hypothetical protein